MYFKIATGISQQKQEQLIPYDTTNHTGCPEEVIKSYQDKKDPNIFMIKDYFQLFNNYLMVKSNAI